LVHFTDLYVAGNPGSYTLKFNCAELGDLNQDLLINAAKKEEKLDEKIEHKQDSKMKPTGLAIATASKQVTVGDPFAEQPRVRLVDASGATVPVTGFVVQASLSGETGSTGVLLPARSCFGVSVMGVVYFNDLMVSGTPGTYSLNFSAAGVGDARQSLDVIGNNKFQLQQLLLQPTDIQIARYASDSSANTVFSTQPRVRFVNSSGGTVPVTGYDVIASVSGGTGTLKPTANCTVSSTAGFCNFTGLYVDAAGTYTLDFTSPGVGQDQQTLNIS
jgi:hypothetical protein